MLRLSYWVLPIISGTVWLGMLLGLLLHWVVDMHRKVYASMDAGQSIAYISDIGAQELQPLFITGCVLTTVFLDAGFLADRWLRHRGRLVPNTTVGEKVLSGLTIVFAVVGTAGLILLSIFDTLRHPMLHDIFLLLFIAGYAISAIFICWEYQSLGRNREHRVLRVSFWIKLAFVIVEVLLAVGFAAANRTGHRNQAAILEWTIAFVFTFYVLSFFVDLYPAVYTKNGRGGHRRAVAPDAFRTKGMPSATDEPHSSSSMSQAAAEEGRSAMMMQSGGGAAGGDYRAATVAPSHPSHHHHGSSTTRPVPQDF